MADVSNETNLFSCDIGPVFTWLLLHLQKLMRNAKAGQVQFRVDKAGIVHATIGRRSFEPGALKNNLVALLDALTKAKPAASKGIYLRKVAVSSTMGAGVRVDQNSLAA